MGLLEELMLSQQDKQDAMNMGLLSGGLGILANNTNRRNGMAAIGQGALMGLQGYGDQLKQIRANKLQDIHMKKLAQELQDQEALRNFDFSKYYMSPQQQAIGMGGPTPEAAAMIPKLQGKFDQGGMLAGMMASNSPALKSKAMEMLTKEETPIALAEGGKLVTKTGREIASNPKVREAADPSSIKEYQFAVNQGFKGTYDQWDLQRRRAGAPAVTVQPDNLGLKPKDRFDMEDKLRGDYSKATDLDSKILATSAKIKAVLSGDPNAIKDQAAIYSFAKLLDPDGAVRESDYAAIMNTAGLSDRIRNYVNKLATGQALSPTQRAEMEGVMNQWEAVAANRIGAAQKTYGSRAKMYNLTPENVFAPITKERPPLSSFNGG